MTYRTSVAVILSAGGAILDGDAIAEMPLARVVHTEFAVGDLATCVAATVTHECSLAELRLALRSWADGRGWSVTVAPRPSPS